MTKVVHNTLAAERRKARHYGMQALYQWLMADATLNDIEAEFRADYDFSHVDLEYFQALLHGVQKAHLHLDVGLGVDDLGAGAEFAHRLAGGLPGRS